MVIQHGWRSSVFFGEKMWAGDFRCQVKLPHEILWFTWSRLSPQIRCCPFSAKIWGILACAKWTLERVAPAKPLFLFAISSRFSGDDGDATRKRPRMKDETCNILQELQSYHDHWCNWALLPLCTGISLVQCGRNMLSLAAEKPFRSYQSFPIQLEVMNQALSHSHFWGWIKTYYYHVWGRTIH